jgi:hypothetical protein
MSELTQLLRGKSIIRYFPPKGIEVVVRVLSRILKEWLRPPARIMAIIFFMEVKEVPLLFALKNMVLTLSKEVRTVKIIINQY